MERKRNSQGDLIICMDEDTLVRVQKDGGVVIRQEMGGITERVFLTVGELKRVVQIVKAEEEKIFFEDWEDGKDE